MNGITILGKAAISGVRRAADIELAAMARWTTRKSVHQYPNDSTKPRPATSPKTSTPMGLAAEEPVNFQACVITGGSRADIPAHPPARFTAIIASGEKPMHDQEKLQDFVVDRAGQPAEKAYRPARPPPTAARFA